MFKNILFTYILVFLWLNIKCNEIDAKNSNLPNGSYFIDKIFNHSSFITFNGSFNIKYSTSAMCLRLLKNYLFIF